MSAPQAYTEELRTGHSSSSSSSSSLQSPRTGHLQSTLHVPIGTVNSTKVLQLEPQNLPLPDSQALSACILDFIFICPDSALTEVCVMWTTPNLQEKGKKDRPENPAGATHFPNQVKVERGQAVIQ
eukprot:1160944-Pelagomonas_calceolata.AAC.15